MAINLVKQLRSQAVGHKAQTVLQSEWPLVDQLVDHQLTALYRKSALNGTPDPFSGTGGLKGLLGNFLMRWSFPLLKLEGEVVLGSSGVWLLPISGFSSWGMVVDSSTSSVFVLTSKFPYPCLWHNTQRYICLVLGLMLLY